MTLGVGGGKVAYDHKDEIKQVVKEWTFGKEKKEEKQKEIKKIEPIYDVSSSEFKENFIDKNWFDIVVSLLEFETWHDIPKKQFKERRQTYGPGLTWVYLNGKQQPCKGRKYVNMAADFTEEQVWDQVKQHCLYQKSASHSSHTPAPYLRFQHLASWPWTPSRKNVPNCP